jgi:hypothetical protein
MQSEPLRIETVLKKSRHPDQCVAAKCPPGSDLKVTAASRSQVDFPKLATVPQ